MAKLARSGNNQPTWPSNARLDRLECTPALPLIWTSSPRTSPTSEPDCPYRCTHLSSLTVITIIGHCHLMNLFSWHQALSLNWNTVMASVRSVYSMHTSFSFHIISLQVACYYYLRSLGDNPRKDVADFNKDYPELATDLQLPPVVPPERIFSSVFRISSAKLCLWTHYDVSIR